MKRAKEVGREIESDWRYREPACHYNEPQPDGRILVRLPKVGDMDSSAILLRICVQAGQKVSGDQSLAEIDCMKMTVDLFSPCDAVVEQILVSDYQTIWIGEPLFVLRPD